jgi:CBS domain-containing protein
MHSVKDEMSRRVAYVTQHDNLALAYSYMQALEIQHVPVVEDERVIGMLSDRDILVHASVKNRCIAVPNVPVLEVMSREVVSCIPSSSIGFAVDLMLHHQVHALPVVDSKDHLVGIVTSSDLLRLLRDRRVQVEEPLPFRFAPVRRLAQLVA